MHYVTNSFIQFLEKYFSAQVYGSFEEESGAHRKQDECGRPFEDTVVNRAC